MVVVAGYPCQKQVEFGIWVGIFFSLVVKRVFSVIFTQSSSEICGLSLKLLKICLP